MSDLPFAKKSLGQHWLTDPTALRSICDAGEVTSEDTVLEIGSGTGTLTELLVGKAKKVIAVEFDAKLARELPERIKSPNLSVTGQDILAYDLTGLPPDYKVVANIPYYLTSKLIRALSETTNQAYKVVVLVQKEVAQRVAAQPGDMSLLSVTAQFYWQISMGAVVPASLFTPPPKVDSQVLILQRRTKLLFPDADTKKLFALVKAGFSARRKKLRSSISGGLRISKDEASKLLLSAGIDPNMRPQELSLGNWHELYKAYETING